MRDVSIPKLKGDLIIINPIKSISRASIMNGSNRKAMIELIVIAINILIHCSDMLNEIMYRFIGADVCSIILPLSSHLKKTSYYQKEVYEEVQGDYYKTIFFS